MKKISLFLLCILMLLCVTGCKVKDNNNNGNNTDIENNGGNNESKINHIEIVVADSAYLGFAQDFAYEIFQNFSGTLSVVELGKESEDKFKIILGETSYSASNLAYRALSEMTDGGSSNITGYATSYDDGCIAIAYTDLLGIKLAGKDFVSNILKNVPNFERGILAKETKDTIAYLDEARNQYRENALSEAEEKLGAETTAELKKLLSIYGQEMYVWLANLWDPDTGAFYYSGSARDTIGFLPDLESTAQAFSLIDASGLMANYDDSYANALSEETKNKIVLIHGVL